MKTNRSAPRRTAALTRKKKQHISCAIGFESLEGRLHFALAAYWNLDDGTGSTAADTSGSGVSAAGYKLTLFNFPTWQSAAQVGGGATFDGINEYGDAGAVPGSAATLSVGFWFRATSLKAQVVVDKLPNDASGIGWSARLAANGSAILRIGSATNFTDVVATTAYTANTWTHFVGTFSGGTARVYINGALRTTTTSIAQSAANTTTSLRVGQASAAFTTELFAGTLDDIRIYDQLLGATPIARQYSVDLLTEATTSQKLKKAALSWGIEDALDDEAFGNTTGATNTYADIATLLSQNIGVAQPSPANLFPAIPSYSSNPIITDAVARLTRLRNNNARMDKNPATYTVAVSGGSYLSVFSGFAADGVQGEWALGDPQTQFYGDARLLTVVLRRFSRVYGALAANVAVSDFGQTPDLTQMYLLFKTVYPDLLLPSKKTAWEAAIKTDVDKTYADHAAVYNARVLGTLWVNADVRFIAELGYASKIFPTNTTYLTAATNGIQLMEDSIYPDGGLPYIDYQNEDYTYHGINIETMARYWQIMGDQNAKDIVTKSYWYYPLSIDSTGTVSYSVQPAWKHYWNQVQDADVAYTVGSLANSPENMRVFQQITGGSFSGMGTLYLATFYNPSVTASPYRDNYIAYDRNDLGGRGRFGNWNFSSTSNPITGQARGVASFVGATTLNSGSGWTLNAALDSAQSRIRFANNTEVGAPNQTSTFYDLTRNARANNTVTDDFAAISSVYNPARYNETTTRNWIGQQEWLLTPQRLFGLVSMRSTATQTAYDVEGILKLVSGRGSWGTAKSFTTSTDPDGVTRYTYGNMNVRILAHNYGGVYLDYVDTMNVNEDTPTEKMGRIRFVDPKAIANGGFDPNDTLNSQLDLLTSSYTTATNHYYMVEIFPTGTSPAVAASVVGDPLSTNLRTMELNEGGRQLRMIDNPTNAPLTYTTNLTWVNGAVLHTSGEQYRPSWLNTYTNPDTDFRGRASAPSFASGLAQGNISITIPAYSHIVLETNTAPAIASAANASPATVTTTSTALSVAANDDAGESNLRYNWSLLSGPSGATAPTFSANNSNAAKTTTTTFSKPGTYNLQVTVTDIGGMTTTSTVTVVVVSTLSSISLQPGPGPIAPGASAQFSAVGVDQFGTAIAINSPVWSTTRGTISATGLLVAPSASGPLTVTLTSGSVVGTRILTVNLVATPAVYAFDNAPPAVQFSFNGDVSASLDSADFTLVNLTTGTTVVSNTLMTSFSSATGVATVTRIGGVLADGNYRFTIAASVVTDASGTPLSAGMTGDFFVLSGDSNRDRVVDTIDFNRLLGSFGSNFPLFSQGNFNYDGVINSLDFAILVAQFGRTLPAVASSALPLIAPAPIRVTATTFGFSPIGHDDENTDFLA